MMMSAVSRIYSQLPRLSAGNAVSGFRKDSQKQSDHHFLCSQLRIAKTSKYVNSSL
jgi:hypothetical protein